MKLPFRARPPARPGIRPTPDRSSHHPRALAAIGLLAVLAAAGGTSFADSPPGAEEIPALDAWVVIPGFGDLRIRFDRDAAPNHVAHFLGLAGSGFYDGLCVHRIVPRLLVQAGAAATREGEPRDWVISAPEYRVAAEADTAPLPIRRGTVAMALQDGEPGTAGTEWFVAIVDSAGLTGLGVPIGEVIEGLPTLDKLEQASTWVSRRPLKRIPFEVRLGPADRPEGAGPPEPGEAAAPGAGGTSTPATSGGSAGRGDESADRID